MSPEKILRKAKIFLINGVVLTSTSLLMRVVNLIFNFGYIIPIKFYMLNYSFIFHTQFIIYLYVSLKHIYSISKIYSFALIKIVGLYKSLLVLTYVQCFPLLQIFLSQRNSHFCPSNIIY